MGAIVILGTGQQFFIYDGSGPPLPEQITITIGSLMCLAQGHCMAPMGFKTVISKFGVKHPTTVLSHKCLMSSLEGFIENNISFGYLLLHIHLSVKTAFLAKKKTKTKKTQKIQIKTKKFYNTGGKPKNYLENVLMRFRSNDTFVVVPMPKIKPWELPYKNVFFYFILLYHNDQT